MALLSKQEADRIASAVEKAESRTAGEIVVQVVERSDDYASVRWPLAFILGAVTAEALHWVPGASGFEVGVGGLVTIAALFASQSSALVRALVRRDQMEAAVHRRAKEAFIDNRVHRTRDASGVLILLSQLEHRVEILADEGIHQRVGVEGWSRHVQTIVEGLKSGAPADGLERAIAAIGEELAQTFPRRQDDVNELPNAPVLGDGA